MDDIVEKLRDKLAESIGSGDFEVKIERFELPDDEEEDNSGGGGFEVEGDDEDCSMDSMALDVPDFSLISSILNAGGKLSLKLIHIIPYSILRTMLLKYKLLFVYRWS